MPGADGAEAPFCAAAGDGLGGPSGREVAAIQVAIIITATVIAAAAVGALAAWD